MGVNDDWIEWNGGECPVDKGTMVEIMFPDGDTTTMDAGTCIWSHDDDSYDIIAYRVITDDPATEGKSDGSTASEVPEETEVPEHPIERVMRMAMDQATKGKGERHGGDTTPFLEQPWAHYAKMHGRGFLTGQAAKKLEEAASTREGQPFIDEILGAIVYLSMSVLHELERGK